MSETELGKAGGVVRTIVETISDEIERINGELERLDKVVRVADRAARDAIPTADRYEGLWVEVLGEAKVYRLTDGLTNDHWQERVGMAAVGVPVASTDQYGVVKIGSGVNVTADGTISVPIPIVFVKGMILPFHGVFSGIYPVDPKTSLPVTTWQICDGSNGTPNLRDRFIVGAGSTYPAKSSGGAASHTHSFSGNVGATTLTIAQMPSHSHDQSYATSGIQSLSSSGFAVFATQGATNSIQFVRGEMRAPTSFLGGGQSHTHSLSTVATSSQSNIPPYYALAYIMYMGG